MLDLETLEINESDQLDQSIENFYLTILLVLICAYVLWDSILVKK